MSRKKTKRKIRVPRKPITTPSTPKGDLPLTPMTEALGMMQAGELDVAMSLVEQHIAANANDALAHHLKGLILHRLKQYPAAVDELSRSIQLTQPQASWLMNLGISQRAAGRHDDAMASFKKSATLDPTYQPARYQQAITFTDKAIIARDLGQHHQAITLLNEALAIDPTLIEARHALAVAHDAIGQRTRAITMQQQLLSEVPDEHPSRLHLADMLRQAGRLNEADTQLAQLPDAPPTRIAKAQLLHVKGQSQAAWDLLQTIDMDARDDINYLILFAQVAPKQSQTPCAIEMLNAALSDTRPVGQQVLLHFALHQLHDKAGDYDRAFEHASQANVCQADVFDPEKQGVFVDSLMKVQFDVASTCSDERPVFIVGMPRSGTSLVEQILARHPGVYAAGELNHIHNLADQLTKQNQYPNKVDQHTATQLALVYQQALNRFPPDSHRITDKMPTNFLHLGLISQMFPKARIIHCTRHPLDTCLSCYFQNFGSYHAYTCRLDWLCAYYRQYRRLMAHWQATLPIAMLDVSYESLVTSPESEIRRLVEFVGLGWNEKCLTPEHADRTVVTASNQQVREPIYQRSVSRWKHYEKHLGALVALMED